MLKRDDAIALIDALTERQIGCKVTIRTYPVEPDEKPEPAGWAVTPTAKGDNWRLDIAEVAGIAQALGLRIHHSPSTGYDIYEAIDRIAATKGEEGS